MKAVFITGGARGIGFAIAQRFHREGWAVTLADLNQEQLATAAHALGAERVRTVVLDVRDYDAFEVAINAHVGEWGSLDLLVNNAGVLHCRRFEMNSVAQHKQTVDVNFTGVVNGFHAGFEALKKTASDTGQAQVLSLCSASSIYGVPEHAVYGATKAAVHNLSEAMDMEWREYGIAVKDILPEYVSTNMVTDIEDAPGTVETMGVSLTAEDVAETSWRAYNRKGVHHMVTGKFAIMRQIMRWIPATARMVMGGAFYKKFPHS